MLVVGIIGSLWLSETSNAAEYQPDIHDSKIEESTAVSGLESSDSIVVMEDGSVIHGEVEISNTSNPSDKILVNSEVDPMAVSVKEYTENLDNVETKEFPKQVVISRAATPPGYYIGLSPRASYNSAGFSAKGWRFAERNYYPTGNWSIFKMANVC